LSIINYCFVFVSSIFIRNINRNRNPLKSDKSRYFNYVSGLGHLGRVRGCHNPPPTTSVRFGRTVYRTNARIGRRVQYEETIIIKIIVIIIMIKIHLRTYGSSEKGCQNVRFSHWSRTRTHTHTHTHTRARSCHILIRPLRRLVHCSITVFAVEGFNLLFIAKPW